MVNSQSTQSVASVTRAGAVQPRWNVLGVDDEPGVLRSLQRLFRGTAFRFFPATSAKEGLFLLAEQTFDIVISDMRMPEVSGAAFLAEVAEKYPDTIRIMMTGYSDLESTIQAVNEGGINQYIQKPWNNEELVLTLEKVAEVIELKRENERLQRRIEAQNVQLKAMNESLEDKVKQRTVQIQQALSQLEQANLQVKDNLRSTIRVFYNLISLKEELGGKATLQTAELSKLLAKGMGLSTREVNSIHLAGLLNELGKLALPDEMLAKSYHELDAEELEIYKQHPMQANLAMAPATGLADVAQIIKHQYERFDGTGVPDHLQGDNLPVGSRILAVARDYIAAVNGRLRPTRHSIEGAVDLLNMNSDRVYDARILRLLPSLVPQLTLDAVKKNERIISIAHLQIGMTLSRNLYNGKSILLLSEGHSFTEDSIKRLKSFEATGGQLLEIYVTDK